MIFNICGKSLFLFKFKAKNAGRFSRGFTLIELLIVLSIMGLLLTLVTVNLTGQRAQRDLKIAQNELVSNLRKAQSYSLSGRLLPNGQSAQYYVVRFNLAAPDRYSIVGLYDVYSSPTMLEMENLSLPKGIIIQSVVINRSTSLTPSAFTPDSCALLAFRLPYGKMYSSALSNPNGCSAVSGQAIPVSDGFYGILTYVTNTNNSAVNTDFTMTITLSNPRQNLSKTVLVQGINGNITSQ